MNVCQRNVARFGHVECRFDKINDNFQGFGNWCLGDFRKMEALKVNKFGRTYRTGTQAARAIIVRSYYFLNLYVNDQLVKRDIVTAVIYYYITTKFHFTTRNVAQRMEVLCMGKNVNRHFSRNFDIFVTKITDLNSNTSIC